MASTTSLRAAFLVLLMGLVTSCAGGESASGEPGPTASESASSQPQVRFSGRLEECGQLPESVAATIRNQLVLDGPGKATLPAVVVGPREGDGEGDTVTVMLHQSDAGGLCGWLEFAALAAEKAGMTALLVDLCGFGQADCPGERFAEDHVAQIALAVDHARSSLEADSVVLVGASMGGTLAVHAAAQGVPVDAVVDLSGSRYRGAVELVAAARKLRVPTLFAYARSDNPIAFKATKRAARVAADAGGEFLAVPSGHGYDLLTDLEGRLRPAGREVLAWITGGFSDRGS